MTDSRQYEHLYSLSDFRAIGKADIALDGITVLAGENGCGKSTLSRWLYYLVNSMNEYGELLEREFARELVVEADRISTVLAREFKMPAVDVFALYNLGVLERVEQQYQVLLDSFRHRMKEKLLSPEFTQNKLRQIFSYLNASCPTEDAPLDKWQQAVDDYCRIKYEDMIADKEAMLKKCAAQDRSKLFDLITDKYGDFSPLRLDIQLVESGVELLEEDTFQIPYLLERAIYVDTPMALGHQDFGSSSWSELRQMVLSPYKKMPEKGRKILLQISRIVGGKFTVNEDDFRNELRYVRRDGLDIGLEQAATGLNAFAYIQQLLQNGYLDRGTLLLIDEPEAHQHPKWIVEFARVLVMLYKELGVKVMLASHNPDMVAAIRSIAMKEGVGEKTNFYIARRREDTMQYDYEGLGTDISEIFKSFNIALERIQEYGEQCSL